MLRKDRKKCSAGIPRSIAKEIGFAAGRRNIASDRTDRVGQPGRSGDIKREHGQFSGQVRLCVDFCHLNKFCSSSSALETDRQISGKLFNVFEAWKGYHQIQLDESSTNLTTPRTIVFGKFHASTIWHENAEEADYSLRLEDVRQSENEHSEYQLLNQLTDSQKRN